MRRVLITHAGGELGVGTARAMRASDPDLHIIGADAGELQIHLAEVDDRHLLPRAGAPEYLPVLRQLINEVRPDFFWPLHDDEIAIVAGVNDLGVRMFIPPADVVRLCQDKLASYTAFAAAGVPVPETISLNTKSDVADALERFQGKTWLRSTHGAGGAGANRVDDLEEAIAWIDSQDGWGTFTASEVLTGRQYKWESVWYQGDLVAAQTRSYMGIGRFRSMATGASISAVSRRERGSQVSGAPEAAIEASLAAIRAASSKPHGIFSVDTSGDDAGVPKVTEINVGRFTSVGAIYWFSQGFNFAETVLKLAFDEDPGFETPLIDPIPAGIYRVSGREVHPAFVTDETMKPLRDELTRRSAKATDS